MTSGNNAQFKLLVQELPVKIFEEDLSDLKNGKRKGDEVISETNSKRSSIEEEGTLSGAMRTFEDSTSATRNTTNFEETHGS